MKTQIEKLNTYEPQIPESYNLSRSSKNYRYIEELCPQVPRMKEKFKNGSRIRESHGDIIKEKSNGKKLKIQNFLKKDPQANLQQQIEQQKRTLFLCLLRKATHSIIKNLLKKVETLFLIFGENKG
jgi:hypothetical protein